MLLNMLVNILYLYSELVVTTEAYIAEEIILFDTFRILLYCSYKATVKCLHINVSGNSLWFHGMSILYSSLESTISDSKSSTQTVF